MKTLKLIIVAALIGLTLVSCKNFREYKRRIAAVEIENIDLQKVADGEYIGEFDAVMVKAKVKVIVKDHKIVNIELLRHDNGKGKLAEVIPGNVVAAQNLQVDTVSKATASSKVILEAIEQALKKGITL
ncbi:MAG: FMN-binding protein [Candidatus Marinimicrobia bacterium]|nr:FMN-binding protein [Candidatus Neomarinimicrobiota bacterium]